MAVTPQTAWLNIPEEVKLSFERALGTQQGAPADGPASRSRG